jgi:hypothetical protein
MPTVNVIARTVYGKTLYYPNSPAAHALVSIDGAKTLSHKHFEAAKALGMMVSCASGVEVDGWLETLLAS